MVSSHSNGARPACPQYFRVEKKYVELEMRMRGRQQFHWMAKGGFSMHGHLITSLTSPHQHAPSVEVTTIHPSAFALPMNVFLLESRFDWMGVETRTKLRHPIGCHGPDCTHEGCVLTLIEGKLVTVP